MRGLKIVGASLAILLAPALAVAGAKMSVELRTEKISKDQAEKALVAFIKSCDPLTKAHWEDVQQAKAVAQEEYAEYRTKSYGWKNHVEVTVIFNKVVKTLPDGSDRALVYFVGAGKKPGIIAQSEAAASLCGMKPDPKGADVFKPVAEMAVLDGSN